MKPNNLKILQKKKKLGIKYVLTGNFIRAKWIHFLIPKRYIWLLDCLQVDWRQAQQRKKLFVTLLGISVC